MREKSSLNLSGAKGRLYWPHQTWPSVDGSRTTNLSLADRAVCLPVFITMAPSRVMRAFPAEDDLLVQRLGREVPVHPAEVEEAVVVQPVVALERRGLRLRGRLDVEQVDHSQSLMRRLSPM